MVDTSRFWDDANAAIKRGAYREALQSLEALLALTPNDSWAQAYRSLCEQRLAKTQSFEPLSAEQEHSLESQLRDEERAQRQAAVQHKRLEQEFSREQQKWDAELKVLEQEAKRQERVKPQPAPAAPLPASAVLVPSGTPVPAVSTAAPSGTAPPQLAPVQPAGVPPAQQPVELSPVMVQTAPGAKPPLMVPVRRKPPPGAVEIHGIQMNVSPDRKIAIAEGDVEVLYQNAVMTCDRMTLFTDTKDLYAEGHVRLEEGARVFRGEMVHYNFDTKKGRFLQGTVAALPWYEFGRSVEHLAEGIFAVNPGYLTSCELEPPHFKLFGSRVLAFAGDKVARLRNAVLYYESIPLFYVPWMVVADRQSPFYVIPGKKKPWGEFVLMGYRYELPNAPGPTHQRGTLKLDWRRNFLWGQGIDYQFEDREWGNALLKVYYNYKHDLTVVNPKAALPKGAVFRRYRVLWRHFWEPIPDTTVVTDIGKFSDVNFRQDFLYRDEYRYADTIDGTVSWVTNAKGYTLTGALARRMNRFQTTTEALPKIALDTREQPIGDTNLFTHTKFEFANLQTKNAHSEIDTDALRADWTHEFSYAMNLFRPIEVTPRFKVRETWFNKDKQGGPERPDGDRNLLSGQWSTGADASLKLFRVFPVFTNLFGLQINQLRHIITPTLSSSYGRRPTVAPENLAFPVTDAVGNQLSFGLENKIQTKRPTGPKGKLQSYDLVRFLISQQYAFRGVTNKRGGVLSIWNFRLETTPWDWLQMSTDWTYPSHYISGQPRVAQFNNDLTVVNPNTRKKLKDLQVTLADQSIQKSFEMKPIGHWAFGLSHRSSYNDKTEETLHVELQPSAKWYVNAFYRLTLKEVAGDKKRFNNFREVQYNLVRDLHDWMATLVYHVDREYGEEVFFMLTLKALPSFPIEIKDSYNEPKFGSQSSPFSPLHGQR